MALEGRDEFTFMWYIENFSMYPHQFDEYVESPEFTVDSLGKTKWRLKLYPRYGKKNHVTCLLTHIESELSMEPMKIISSIFLISARLDKSIKLVREYVSCVKGFTEYITYTSRLTTREDVFNGTNGFLPNDTLTIKCELKDSVVRTDESKRDATEVRYRNLNVNQGSARTRIKVTSESILWPIRHFSSLRPGEKLLKTVESGIRSQSELEITFYWKGLGVDSCGNVEIRLQDNRDDDNGGECSPNLRLMPDDVNGGECSLNRRLMPDDDDDAKAAEYFVTSDDANFPNTGECSGTCDDCVYMRAKIKCLGGEKSFQYETEGECYFRDKEKDVLQLPAFLCLKELVDEKYFYYTDDVLYMHCQFLFSRVGDEYSVNATHSIEDSENILVPRQNEDYHFDVDTVDRLLKFLYTDTLDNLDPECAAKLYKAADIYDVMPLKCRCSCYLMSALSVSNVCKVLKLADACNDGDLLEVVRDFIHTNGNEVFRSQDWEDLTHESPFLAATTMRLILTEKYLI